MNKKQVKSALKKTWHFIWEEDSIASWIVNIILAFILIKFLVYPALGFIFHTGFPVVAVVSGSMEHGLSPVCQDYDQTNDQCLTYSSNMGFICGNIIAKQGINFDKYWSTCGNWYASRNITKDEFQGFSFRNGFNTGDIMVLYGEDPTKIKLGDIIVFSTSTRPDPIIHRVVKITKDQNTNLLIFATKGDHNEDTNTMVNEGMITQDRYIGKAVFRIPYLGWIKIGFVNFINWIKAVI